MDGANYRTAVDLIIKSITSGTPRHEVVLEIGQTPEMLVNFGLPPLLLVITGKTIDKIFFDHGITKGVIERLYNLILSPSAIYKSAPPHLPGAVVVTFEIQRGMPVIVTITSNKQFGRNYFANEISSVYGKEGGTFEKNWQQKGLLLWKK